MKKLVVPENKTIQEMEDETIKYWQDNKIFEKSVEQRSADNLFIFYDGPPFISGLPHYGHLLGSIAKDVIPRYWTMKGKRVERLWGWDAHGLTVENKVQKKLGIKNRRDIENYGLEKFVKECYLYTSETSAEWPWYINKIGRWVDIEHAYKTTDQNYMESVIWAFKQMYDKGLIYEGVYTSLYCPTCGTPVSNFEIVMDNSYKDYEDPAITIMFPIETEGEFKGVNILAWTTTPWTMPSNRALVVKRDEPYAVVESEGVSYCLAKPRLEAVFKDRPYKILNEILGEKLIGLSYKPPYDFYKSKENEFKIYSYEGMVTMTDGTGVVHSAPGFGEIDTAMGREYGLTLMLTIDDEGKFIPGNNGTNPFEGIYYSKANPLIINDLQEKGVLFESAKIVHRIPYHDRCDSLLIQRAQNSWFVGISKIKEKLLKNNENINWIPDHLKDGRFSIGIKQAPDWCISRSRYWATPMPVWKSDDGEIIVISSVSELEKLSGQKITDLHRPYIDSVVINKDGKTFKRIPEVLDSWFEAGSMPYAQMHYPMENQLKFEKNFPGDYVAEYIAQTRAWFFFMHVLSTSLFDSNSFKNVISTGVMSGTDGRKMSKSYGNYTDPKEVLEKIGGDALRLYLMGSPLMMGENANFDHEELTNKLKNVINPLWNSLKFFLIYADQHNWAPKDKGLSESKNILDIWILTKLNIAIQGISENIEKYTIPDAVRYIEVFIDDLSRWYVRRSRSRFADGDTEALDTAYRVFLDFSKAAAPLIPFISEKIYSLVSDENISVHLEDYPKYYPECVARNTKLVEEMDSDRLFVSEILSLRIQHKIPVRQPLQQVITSKPVYYKDIVCDELNVKEVVSEASAEQLSKLSENGSFVFDNSKSSFLNTAITQELKLEGSFREFTRKIQDLRKIGNLTVSDKINVEYPDTDENKELLKVYENNIKTKVFAVDLIPSTEFKITKIG